MRTLQPLSAFVELRRRLLLAELQAADLVGRSADVGKIKAEFAGLLLQPADALMIRVGHGRLIGGYRCGPDAFENQMNVVKRRLSELETEVAQWQATHAAARKG